MSPDGTRIFTVGHVQEYNVGVQRRDYVVEAWDVVTGLRVWVHRYSGPHPGYGDPRSMAVTPDGATVVVTGSIEDERWHADIATLALNADTGAALWVARDNAPAESSKATALAVTDDAVVVTGWIRHYPSSDIDLLVRAYDRSTGALEWKRRVGPAFAPGAQQRGTAAAMSPDGQVVVVAGFAETPATGNDILVLAYDVASGGRLWNTTYAGRSTANDSPVGGLAFSSNGDSIFVAGRSASNYTTLSLGLDGAIQWHRTYRGPVVGSADEPHSLAARPGGGVVVTGQVAINRNEANIATVAYLDNGTRDWAVQWSDPARSWDDAFDVAVGPDGAVYVTGRSYADRPTWSDGITIAYEPTGVIRWTAWLHEVQDDWAHEVLVSPAGDRVFVAAACQEFIGPNTVDGFVMAVAYAT